MTSQRPIGWILAAIVIAGAGCRVCSPQPCLRRGAHWILPSFGRSGGSPMPCCGIESDYSTDWAEVAAGQQCRATGIEMPGDEPTDAKSP